MTLEEILLKSFTVSSNSKTSNETLGYLWTICHSRGHCCGPWQFQLVEGKLKEKALQAELNGHKDVLKHQR